MASKAYDLFFLHRLYSWEISLVAIVSKLYLAKVTRCGFLMLLFIIYITSIYSIIYY